MARGAKKPVRVQSTLERFKATMNYADSLEIPEDAQKLDVAVIQGGRNSVRLSRKQRLKIDALKSYLRWADALPAPQKIGALDVVAATRANRFLRLFKIPQSE